MIRLISTLTRTIKPRHVRNTPLWSPPLGSDRDQDVWKSSVKNPPLVGCISRSVDYELQNCKICAVLQ